MEEIIKFGVKEFETFVMLEFVIVKEGGKLTPSDLKKVSLPPIPINKGVAILVIGPVWLYCNFTHLLSYARWIGTFEPRSNSIVVAVSRVNTPSVGDLISF